MSLTKDEVRALLKARLRAVTPEMRADASHRAAQNLLALSEFQQARTVMAFLSLKSELDTRPVIEAAWSAGKTLLVPRAHMHDRTMEPVQITSFDEDLKQTAIGVYEPVSENTVDPAAIDLVVVPGLGFGPSGERIGRGAGFYDRFLPRARDATWCGFCFEMQVVEGIPMSGTDTAIHMLVTETGVRRFTKRTS